VSSFSFFKKSGAPASGNSFSGLLSAVGLFAFAAVFVPLVGPVFLFLLPMIAFVNGATNGIFKTALCLLFSLAVLMLLSVGLNLDVPAVAIFTMGMAGLLMAHMAAENYSIEKIVTGPVLLIFGAIGFYFVYDAVGLGVNPWLLVKNFITVTISETIKFYSQMPLKPDDISMIKDNENNIINSLIHIFPSLMVILSVFIIWANLLLGKTYLRRFGIVYAQMAILARWKVTDWAIWIFIISGLLLFIPQKNFNFIGLNVFLIVCLVYLLQGLAIVSFLFQNKNVPFLIRYIFYFLIAVQQILMIPIAVIGLFDVWFDFRKRFQKNHL
jgi:uncharacterized protein YybS (DUF2232 family)